MNILATQAIDDLGEKVDLILYLQPDADTLLITQLTEELKAFPETITVSYTSREEALESLLEKYSDQIDPFSEYNLENPLPSSLQIITEDPEDHETIMAYLEQSTYKTLLLDIESNQDNQQIVNNLIQVTQFSEKILMGIIITFLIGSGLIITNAIHMTIFSRKKEIQIMRLVGANLNFIRSPFLIEGGFYGAMAVIISLALLIGFMQNLDLTQLSYLTVDIKYGRLFLFEIISGVAVGMTSSWMATHYYLKKTATL